MRVDCVSALVVVLVIVSGVLVEGNYVRLVVDDDNGIKLGDKTVPLVLETSSRRITQPRWQANHQRTIQHFAEYGICHNFVGRQRFYLALKSTLCHTRGAFIAKLVRYLCQQRGEQLVNWISELFDTDGDGYITHHERKMYDRLMHSNKK